MALVRCCVVSSFKAGSWVVISGVVVVGLLTGRSVCVWIASVVGWLLAMLRLYVVMYAGVLYLNVIYCGASRSLEPRNPNALSAACRRLLSQRGSGGQVTFCSPRRKSQESLRWFYSRADVPNLCEIDAKMR